MLGAKFEPQGPIRRSKGVCGNPTVSSAEHSPFQVTVHNGEEHLQEEVDGVYQHRQQVQPCFAGHCTNCVRYTSPVFELNKLENANGLGRAARREMGGQAAAGEMGIWRCGVEAQGYEQETSERLELSVQAFQQFNRYETKVDGCRNAELVRVRIRRCNVWMTCPARGRDRRCWPSWPELSSARYLSALATTPAWAPSCAYVLCRRRKDAWDFQIRNPIALICVYPTIFSLF